jgi:hypothetical protein
VRRGALGPLVGALLVLAASVLPLLRNGGVGTWDTIWIEDGIYVQDADSSGPFAVLFRANYTGYLQLVTRLLAAPTAFLPSPAFAVYLAVSATLLCALCAAFVYRQTDGLIASIELRLVVAAMVVFMPAMAIETTATVTNTIWTVLAVAPFAFISVKDSALDVVLRAAIAFLAATATALAFLFVPLALGYAIARRTRAAWTIAGVYAVGLVMQVLVIRGSPVSERSANSVRTLVDMFGLRVLGSFLVGERPLDQLWTGAGEAAVVVIVLVFAGLLLYLLNGAGRRNQVLAGVLVLYAGAAFVLPAWGRGTETIGFGQGVYSLNMTRYTVGPILLLMTAVAVLVAPALEPRVRALPAVAPRVVVVWAVVVMVAGFFYPTVRGAGPAWRSESARVFAEDCDGQPSDQVVRVTTTPTTFWIELPCRRLAP